MIPFSQFCNSQKTLSQTHKKVYYYIVMNPIPTPNWHKDRLALIILALSGIRYYMVHERWVTLSRSVPYIDY